MLEVILKFGFLATAAVVLVVFFAVYFLAEPHSEISFWGLKFKKRWSPRRKLNWRWVPRKIPDEWKVILKAFEIYDSTLLAESNLFDVTSSLAEFSQIKTRQVCVEMEKYGLIERGMGNYLLKDRALPILNGLDDSAT